jgi:3-oxoacyl-[acyl-carrier-protein] synthase-3
MNWADVFNFVIREVPRDFDRLIEFAGVERNSIDYFIFHQANSYINGFLARKLRLPEERIPTTIHKYGNTSSVSIPLTIVSELSGKLNDQKRILLSGFGVGLTWGTAIIHLNDCFIGDIVEV